MNMNRIIKQLLIIVFVFLVILWIQKMDDNSKNKKRDNLYDKIKLPLLVSAIVGLLLNIDLSNIIDNKVESEIIIIKPKCNLPMTNPGMTNPGIINQDVYLDLDF